MALVCDIKSNPAEENNAQKPDDDLEDGEIEDDDEDIPLETQEPPKIDSVPLGPLPVVDSPKRHDSDSKLSDKSEKYRDKPEKDRRKHEDKLRKDEKTHRHMTEAEKSILHLRKREKMMREREKWDKVHRKEPVVDPLEDDFAKNIEKTLATILSKKEKEAAAISGGEEKEEEKRGKKRKKHDKDRASKGHKHRHLDSPKSEEFDENEMLNIRGGSPEPKNQSRSEISPYLSDESMESEYSDQSDRSRRKDGKRERRREHYKEKRRERERERKNNNKPELQDSQGVCVFYMQGKCQKNDCPYSHEANPPMKLELCKFYLMECCAKGEKCSYMHSEFPCKFYHTGLQCTAGDDCKFAHGKPLTEGLKQILFKHIETAPRDILGGFPRMSREEALNMINTTQKNLQDQFGTLQETEDTASKGGIPSLFDINVPIPPELLVQGNDDNKPTRSEKSGRSRPSRWQDPEPTPSFPFKPLGYGQDQDMRINSNGDIDMRTLPPSIPTMTTQPKVPNTFSDSSMDSLDKRNITPITQDVDIREQFPRESSMRMAQDTDIRNPTMLTTFNSKDVDIRQPNSDPRYLSQKDVDIRQLPNVFEEKTSKGNETEDEPMLEIDTGEEKNDSAKNVIMPNLSQTTQDLFARINSRQKDNTPVESQQQQQQDKFDVDITDINWYSDDDDEDENRLTIKVEEEEKHKEERDEDSNKNDRPDTPPSVKPLDMVEKLGDLSKIDISAEVTKLLTSMSQNRQTTTASSELTSGPEVLPSIGQQDPRLTRQDPRTNASSQETTRTDPRLSSDPRQRSRTSSTENQEKRSDKMSIYEQGSLDGILSNDIDSEEFRVSLRPDTDLRNMGLPFKGMQNYTPATEIDASLNAHPPIQWKVAIVDIPRPDYTGLKLSVSDAEKTGDPRLRKIFRLSTEEKDSPMSPRASPKSSSVTRIDPRLRKMEEKTESQMNYTQQLSMLQSSVFYQSLTSNQKLMLNQELASRSDHSGSHDPVLNSLLTNLNLIPNVNIQSNPNLGAALSILANVNKINTIMPQNAPGNVLNPPPMMVQQGLLGAAPGIPNMPPDFPINFDPRNGGLLGNAPPPGFGGGFPPVDPGFNNFGGGDDFYPQDAGFVHNRDNRGFNNNNRDRRRGRNFNNRNNRNFRNNNNRNNHRPNRNHSPP